MNRPVIFLDFDGVLNTEQYQARLAVEGEPTKDAWGPLFDPRAVENLRRIIDATDAGIVVSSSWRYAHRLGSLRMMWEVRELPGEIIDTIPCGATYISRGEDIECWLDEHGCHDYVIIDDLDDFSPAQHDRYIETNPIVGITEADATRAIAILNLTYNRMNLSGVSFWNSFPIHGDIEELDRLVAASNQPKAFDKTDIIHVLSPYGDSYVTNGINESVVEATKEAINNLPCTIEELGWLLFCVSYGNEEPDEDEYKQASSILSDANGDMIYGWGMSSDCSLGDSFKVVLIATLES